MRLDEVQTESHVDVIEAKKILK